MYKFIVYKYRSYTKVELIVFVFSVYKCENNQKGIFPSIYFSLVYIMR